MENSHIEWTDHTWNPWIGCTKVDKLCTNCYAEARDIRFADGAHWGKGAPRQRTSPGNWRDPYRWNRAYTEAERANRERFEAEQVPFSGEVYKPLRRPKVFIASLADWLDDEVPIEWLADALHVIDENRNLIWLPLTKRPQNWRPRLMAVLEMLKGGDFGPRKMIEEWLAGRPPEHVWMGTSVGDQASADKRIPLLLEIPAVIRFLSCEPLLGAIQFSDVTKRSDAVAQLGKKALGGIHWVICGGESGQNARPMHPNWARSIRDQVAAAGAAFFFKQWGEWLPLFDSTASKEFSFPDGERVFRVGKKASGNLLDGRAWKEFPA